MAGGHEIVSTKVELNAYIDESGDEGFKQGSSQWFIIVGVVVDRDNDRDVASAVNAIKSRVWGEQITKPLHWTRLDHKRKLVCLSEINKHDFTIFAVAMEKKYLDRKKFDSSYDRENRVKFRWAMYFYATKLLVERITMYAQRMNAKVGLVFENRASISYNQLRDYLTLMTMHSGKTTIASETIRSLESKNKQTSKLLQVADICAGSLYDALQLNQYGQVDDTYLQYIIGRFYRLNGKLWGYGLKLFPRSPDKQLAAMVQEYNGYNWMANTYR